MSKVKIGCGGILIIIIISIISIVIFLNTAFGKKRYTVNIEQNIGGTLVCDVEYSSDHKTWFYFIDYKYKLKEKVYNFGKGIYRGVEWNESNQLHKCQNWTILPTESDFGFIKIIAFDLEANKKKESKISPHSINEDIVWTSKRIKSLLAASPSSVEVEKIVDNKFFIKYTFRTDRENVDNLDVRLIEYELDEVSGAFNMRTISELKEKPIYNLIFN
ncbi:hypothetical protein WAF17_22005 [Bernardetia sp. ABR2-2B]|uniref:hypothetical protein n=1 Tax=Bernardetia sp. ABR2-2B TaxID=3127472 RepID=UPI0030D3F33E